MVKIQLRSGKKNHKIKYIVQSNPKGVIFSDYIYFILQPKIIGRADEMRSDKSDWQLTNTEQPLPTSSPPISELILYLFS